MKEQKFLRLAVVLGLTLSGCSSSIPDLTSGRKASNVATTEADGVVTAKINPSATTDQTVVGSTTSNVADASISFPPGALAIETTLAVGEAVDLSAGIASAAGLTAVVATKGAPLFAAPATGDIPLLTKDVTIVLPLPVSANGLSLTATSGKLVFLYTVYTSTGWKSGVKPLTAANLVGTFLKTEVKGLGYFQIAYLSEKVEEKEFDTTTQPGLQGNAAAAK